MNSLIRYLKLLLLIFGLTWSLISFSAPVSGRIEFLNESGLLVGNGQFTYDPTTTITCAKTDGVGGVACDPDATALTPYLDPDDHKLYTINTAFDSISINLIGKKWIDATETIVSSSAFYGIFWLNEPSTGGPGSFLLGREGGVSDSWLFFNAFSSPSNILNIDDFTQNSNTSWSGTWVAGLNIGSSNSISDRGLVTITVVPVPGTLLFLSGLVVVRIGWKKKNTQI